MCVGFPGSALSLSVMFTCTSARGAPSKLLSALVTLCATVALWSPSTSSSSTALRLTVWGTLPEPFVTQYVSYLVFIPPMIAMLITRPLWVPVSTAEGPVWAWCDPNRMMRVMHNILGNAVSYSDRRTWPEMAGPVPQAPGHIIVTVAMAEGVATWSCADNGRGIAPADLGRLGQEFVRLNGSHAAVVMVY